MNKKLVLNLDAGYLEVYDEHGQLKILNGKGLGICERVRVDESDPNKPQLVLGFEAEEVVVIRDHITTRSSAARMRDNTPRHMVPGISPELTAKRLDEIKHLETPCTCTYFAEPHTMGWHLP